MNLLMVLQEEHEEKEHQKPQRDYPWIRLFILNFPHLLLNFFILNLLLVFLSLLDDLMGLYFLFPLLLLFVLDYIFGLLIKFGLFLQLLQLLQLLLRVVVVLLSVGFGGLLSKIQGSLVAEIEVEYLLCRLYVQICSIGLICLPFLFEGLCPFRQHLLLLLRLLLLVPPPSFLPLLRTHCGCQYY